MDAGGRESASFLEPIDATPDERRQLPDSFRLILRLRFIVFPAVLALVLLASLAGPTRRNLLDGPTLLLHAINAVIVLSLNALALLLVRRVASPLAFLYYGPIFAASILAGTRAVFATAGLAARAAIAIADLRPRSA